MRKYFDWFLHTFGGPCRRCGVLLIYEAFAISEVCAVH